MWQLKKTNLVLLPDNGTGLGYVFIFSHGKKVGGQVTRISRIQKAKKRYIVLKPCATGVTRIYWMPPWLDFRYG
jgi:hypothetical protein